jgi:outer membrane protein OmpA-like peptidoglycan-associated protein
MIQRNLLLLLLASFIGFSTTSVHAQITVLNERGINTAFQEYSPAFYQKGLIFIASNPAVNKDKKEDTQLGKSTTSIFFAKRGNDGNLQRPVTFAEELTTKFYDGPLSFNAAGDVVFFTRTNLRNGKPKAARDGKVKLKIYSAKFNTTSGKWEKIEELPFNGNDFDCMHPSVSADGQRLYFASNRPGGSGGLDIYVSTLQAGKWSSAVNLGPSINTPKNEVFPFIHLDNTLYFSTSGHKGTGGIDIFWTKRADDKWLEPMALPEPINSSSDDFGIIVTDDKKSGFFSSNRSSGQGDDDIFSFQDSGLEAQMPTKDAEPDDAPIVSKPKKEEVKTAVLPVVKEEKMTPVLATKEEPKTVAKEDLKSSAAKTQTPPEVIVAAKKVVNNSVSVIISTVDKTSNKPIKDVSVSILNMKSIKNATFMTDATGKVTGLRAESGAPIPIDILPSQEALTDAQGNIELPVNEGDRFIFNFSKTGFDSKYVVKTIMKGDNKVAAFMSQAPAKPVVVNTKSVGMLQDSTPRNASNLVGNRGERSYDFEESKTSIVSEQVQAESGGFAIELRSKYTSFDDAEVNEQTKTELEPLLKMMKQDKTIEIEVASHTDAKGKANFNLTLSQLRADNIKTYFVENGIKPDRIRSFGYGETMVRNRCKRGVACTEEEHVQNRRSVVKVVKGLDNQSITEGGQPQQTVERPTKSQMVRAANIPTRGNQEATDFIASNDFTTNSIASNSSQRQHFHVVIGTFTKPENAEKQKRKAVDAGFVEAEVIQDENTFLYSVSVRLFTDQKEARKLSEYINSQKEFEAFVKEWK